MSIDGRWTTALHEDSAMKLAWSPWSPAHGAREQVPSGMCIPRYRTLKGCTVTMPLWWLCSILQLLSRKSVCGTDHSYLLLLTQYEPTFKKRLTCDIHVLRLCELTSDIRRTHLLLSGLNILISTQHFDIISTNHLQWKGKYHVSPIWFCL